MLIFDFPPPRVLGARFRKEILFENAAFQDKFHIFHPALTAGKAHLAPLEPLPRHLTALSLTRIM